MNTKDKEALREILQAFMSAESRCMVAKKMLYQPEISEVNIEQALLACENAIHRLTEFINK